jgi:electron transfer flavoprotein alpha subunit
MDLAAVLAATTGIPIAVNCREIQIEDGRLVATSQMCGGKLLCEIESARPPWP